jgi:hypothetical protein
MIKRTAPHPVSSDFINRACAGARGLRRRGHEEGHNVERLDVQGLDEEGQHEKRDEMKKN